jgi:hypothetical protein
MRYYLFNVLKKYFNNNYYLASTIIDKFIDF